MLLLPQLSEVYHLTPTDVWDLTAEEADHYIRDLNRKAREARKRERESRRHQRSGTARRR